MIAGNTSQTTPVQIMHVLRHIVLLSLCNLIPLRVLLVT